MLSPSSISSTVTSNQSKDINKNSFSSLFSGLNITGNDTAAISSNIGKLLQSSTVYALIYSEYFAEVCCELSLPCKCQCNPKKWNSFNWPEMKILNGCFSFPANISGAHTLFYKKESGSNNNNPKPPTVEASLLAVGGGATRSLWKDEGAETQQLGHNPGFEPEVENRECRPKDRFTKRFRDRIVKKEMI